MKIKSRCRGVFKSRYKKVYSIEKRNSKGFGFSEPASVTGKTAFSRIINEITIHHTDTPKKWSLEETVKSISKTHDNRFAGNTKSCKGVDVAYHYLVGEDGRVVQTRCLDEIGYHNSKNNKHSIGIAMAGDFNKEKPSEEQYKALNVLLGVLTQIYTGAEIKPHWTWNSNCPGKYFDKNRISILGKNSLLGIYDMTRYYSPQQGQPRYYLGKTYEQDVTINCGASAIGNDGCSYPANGIKLKDSDSKIVIACPGEFPLGTKLNIKSYGWVTCVDRGGAIKGRRLDLWAGYGMAGLEYIEQVKRPAGDIEVIDIDFSNVKK